MAGPRLAMPDTSANAALAAMLGRRPPSPEAQRMKEHLAQVVAGIEARQRKPVYNRHDDEAEGHWDGVDERIWK